MPGSACAREKIRARRVPRRKKLTKKVSRCRMPSSRKLTEPIVLKVGRTIATLSQAREMMLSIPIDRRRGEMWRYIAELLNEAAADNTASAHVDAEGQLIRALKAEGLL